MEDLLSKSVKETTTYAEKFIKNLVPTEGKATVVCLHGDLGSGKTTFVKSVAKILSIEGVVTSPTFVIEKVYELKNKNFNKLFHIDAYRLSSGNELLSLGWKGIINDSKNIIFIEWPKYVTDVLPTETYDISFEFIDENTRSIKSGK